MKILCFWVDFHFKWYDLWIGFYLEKRPISKTLYFCPFPMCVFEISKLPKRR